MDEIFPCPRCQEPIQQAGIAGVEVERCLGCGGLLVEQCELFNLMGVLVRELGVQVTDEDAVPVIPDERGPASCPDCHGPMKRFGYMESRYVTLDRCGSCAVVWIDDGELGSMVALFARTCDRKAIQERDRAEWARRLSALFFIGASDGRVSRRFLR